MTRVVGLATVQPNQEPSPPEHDPAPGVAAARPGTGFTPDGRRIRQVVSYTRRGVRLSAEQQEWWDAYRDAWWISDDLVDEPGFTVTDRFEHPDRPLLVEVGSGVGEATVAWAGARPDANVLALEVWRPGVAETLGRIARAGVPNVRVLSVDAVWSAAHLLSVGQVEELWTFFPDPWPKTRHLRRRLVNPPFVGVAASRLRAGGLWRLATDWPHYAAHIRDVMDAQPRLERAYEGSSAERFPGRPMTRFERRAVREGRSVQDFTYRRRPSVGR